MRTPRHAQVTVTRILICPKCNIITMPAVVIKTCSPYQGLQASCDFYTTSPTDAWRTKWIAEVRMFKLFPSIRFPSTKRFPGLHPRFQARWTEFPNVTGLGYDMLCDTSYAL